MRQPDYQRDGVTLYCGDCLDILPELEAGSVDSIVTDPPYGLSFMGKNWDHGVPGESFWAEALRVAKPGAHLLAFGGTRTFHRLTCAIEDAGWEIRDCVMWVYGSGFPKSHDVSKAIDKAAGVKVETRGHFQFTAADNNATPGAFRTNEERANPGSRKTAPATTAARQWSGWGTALKPAWESIILATKPLTAHGERRIIVENLTKLEAQLWSLLPASVAEKSFGLNPSEFDAVCDSAQWSVEARSNTRDALCEVMDMSQFVSATISSLNTVSSWRSIFAESCEPKSTSTTETASSPTIDWKTLRSCVSALTPRSIIEAATTQPGSWWSALPAARVLSAAAASIANTQELSAAVRAISTDDGEGLHPDAELVCVARKPLDGTVAANVLEHGTGALNVDGCRVGTEDVRSFAVRKPGALKHGGTNHRPHHDGDASETIHGSASGRWPANLIHDGSEEVVGLFPETVPSVQRTGHRTGKAAGCLGDFAGQSNVSMGHSDNGGSAARFFYCAKASKADRNEGCEALEPGVVARSCQAQAEAKRGNVVECEEGAFNKARHARNHHPTVKPTELMRYLCRLVTPPGGVVLDPFVGSGSTGKAAVLEGFRFVGIEREAEYLDIARARITAAMDETPLFSNT